MTGFEEVFQKLSETIGDVRNDLKEIRDIMLKSLRDCDRVQTAIDVDQMFIKIFAKLELAEYMLKSIGPVVDSLIGGGRE